MQDGTCSTPATARSNQAGRAVQILQRKRNQLRCATAPTQRSPSRPVPQSWSRVDQVASRAEDALGSLSRQRRNRSQLSTARSSLSRSSSNASTSRLKTPGGYMLYSFLLQFNSDECLCCSNTRVPQEEESQSLVVKVSSQLSFAVMCDVCDKLIKNHYMCDYVILFIIDFLLCTITVFDSCQH